MRFTRVLLKAIGLCLPVSSPSGEERVDNDVRRRLVFKQHVHRPATEDEIHIDFSGDPYVKLMHLCVRLQTNLEIRPRTRTLCFQL